jgi:hypothetical protein
MGRSGGVPVAALLRAMPVGSVPFRLIPFAMCLQGSEPRLRLPSVCAMPGGVERKDVFAAAKELGWRVAAQPNKKGYFKMWCPCGLHSKWLHKTPSNPHYYREYIQKMRSLGCRPRAGLP